MQTLTNIDIKNPTHTTTTGTYPKLAFCSAITPATPEHYKHLQQAGIRTVNVCLHLSGYSYYKFATIHTQLARQAGMVTHAFMVTDLKNPVDDVVAFTQRYNALAYDSGTKVTIWVTSNKYVQDREERIAKMINLLSNYIKRSNIDITVYKRDIDAKMYDLGKLPKMINLTVINVSASFSGVSEAGTWVYTTDFCGETQAIAYDFYGFYTDNSGYQMSLIDTDYVVQRGDTWYSIARRHGMPIVDLLAMNRAVEDDKLFEGQIVRIA